MNSVRFRRIKPRDDIAEIRTRCTVDSIDLRGGDVWRTSYRDAYPGHNSGAPERVPAPSVSITIGGGSFAPNRDEVRSQYMNTFHKREPTEIPKLAIAPTDSEVTARNFDLPRLSTAHASMRGALEGPGGVRTRSVPQSARSIGLGQRSKNFDLGGDRVGYDTTTGSTYKGRNGDMVGIDPRLKASSMCFDKEAGLGPHERSLTKRKRAPSLPRPPPMDQSGKNFDTGHDRDRWKTTHKGAYVEQKVKRVDMAHAPPTAPRCDDGEYAPKWGSTYKGDYLRKRTDLDTVDLAKMRRTNFDPGHDSNEWPVHAPPPQSARVRPVPSQTSSNMVFRGDGKVRNATTAKSLTGQFDREAAKSARRDPSTEGRKLSVMVGADGPTLSTTAKDANVRAGSGKASESCAHMYDRLGGPHGHGGDWGENTGKKMDGIKKYRPVEPASPVDGRWHRRTNFNLEATSANKGRYTTTYNKTICRPAVEA